MSLVVKYPLSHDNPLYTDANAKLVPMAWGIKVIMVRAAVSATDQVHTHRTALAGGVPPNEGRRRLVIQPIYVTTMALCAIVTSIPQVIGTSLACA